MKIIKSLNQRLEGGVPSKRDRLLASSVHQGKRPLEKAH